MNQPSSLTEEALAQIDGCVAAATAGPWTAHVEGRDFLGGSSCITTGADDIELSGAREADYDFIANARQDIPGISPFRRQMSLRILEKQLRRYARLP